MEEIYKSYIRWAAGIFAFVIGVVFMLIPFIPIGYLFIIFSVFILAPKIPFLKKWVHWLKEKDKRGNINKVESWINQFELWLSNKFSKKKAANSSTV